FAVFFWLRYRMAMPPLKSYDYIGLTVTIIIVPWMISLVKICRTLAQPREVRVARLIVAASVCFAITGAISITWWLKSRPHENPVALCDYLALTAMFVVGLWIIIITRICKIPGKTYPLTLILATALILIAQFVTGYLLRY